MDAKGIENALKQVRAEGVAEGRKESAELLRECKEALEFYAGDNYNFDAMCFGAFDLWEDGGDKAKQTLARINSSGIESTVNGQNDLDIKME